MSGLAGQAIGLEDQSPTPIGGAAAVDTESKGSMENFIGFGLGATSYDPNPVDFDAADDTVTSAADGSTRVAPEYTDNELSWGGAVPPTPFDGIFFDTARGDSFLTLSYPSIPELVVSATQVHFNSATALDAQVVLKDSLGNQMLSCFDHFKLEADYEMFKFPVVTSEGFVTGFAAAQGTIDYGTKVQAFPGYVDYFQLYSILQNTNYETDSTFNNDKIATSFDIKAVLEVTGNVLKANLTKGGVTATLPDVSMPYPASSFSMPNGLQNMGVLFKQADCILNSLKINVSFPNALYVFVGDSLTQGRFASTYAESFVQHVRDQYPDDVICCGAHGAVIADWLTKTQAVREMRPKYVFLLMGSNDINLNTPVATVVSQHQQLMTELTSSGALGICISIYPQGGIEVPAVNSQLQAIYPRYVDVYSLLKDGSTSNLNPLYANGDGLHLNSAGNAVVANAVLSAITTNGWN